MAGIAVSTKAKVVTENNRALVERAYQTIRDMILCHQVRHGEKTSVARLADDIRIKDARQGSNQAWPHRTLNDSTRRST